MKTFFAQSGLEFQGIDFNNLTGNDNYLGKQYIRQLNSWKSPKIDEFIVDTTLFGPLGNFMKDSSSFLKNRALYFIFDRQEIIATSLIIPNSPLLGSKELGIYVSTSMLGKDYEQSFLKLSDAVKIKNNPFQNNCEIAYLVVNPKRFNQGYGKQAIFDICDNIDQIAENPQFCAITQIDELNKASIKAFEKNGFANVPAKGKFNYYYKLLHNPKHTEKEL